MNKDLRLVSIVPICTIGVALARRDLVCRGASRCRTAVAGIITKRFIITYTKEELHPYMAFVSLEYHYEAMSTWFADFLNYLFIISLNK